jgi:hypothetical protein
MDVGESSHKASWSTSDAQRMNSISVLRRNSQAEEAETEKSRALQLQPRLGQPC